MVATASPRLGPRPALPCLELCIPGWQDTYDSFHVSGKGLLTRSGAFPPMLEVPAWLEQHGWWAGQLKTIANLVQSSCTGATLLSGTLFVVDGFPCTMMTVGDGAAAGFTRCEVS